MRISEVSRATGIPATALRYYEDLGLITVRRGLNGYRDYDQDVLTRLDLIEASKELGLPLADIGAHLATVAARSCTEVRDHLQPVLAEQLAAIRAKRARLARLEQRLAAAAAGLAECPDSQDRCLSECALAAPGHRWNDSRGAEPAARQSPASAAATA